MNTYSYDMVRQALDQLGVRYLVEANGDGIWSMWSSNTTRPFRILVTIEVDGQVLAIRTVGDQLLPASCNGRVLEAANRWNVQSRFLKTHVQPAGEGTLRIVAESQMLCGAGADVDVIATLFRLVASGATDMLAAVWAGVETPSSDELREWYCGGDLVKRAEEVGG